MIVIAQRFNETIEPRCALSHAKKLKMDILAPTPNANLRDLLANRATLYSGNETVRSSLVDRTLRAAAYGVELNPDLSIEEALYEVMADIAKTDVRLRCYGQSSELL